MCLKMKPWLQIILIMNRRVTSLKRITGWVTFARASTFQQLTTVYVRLKRVLELRGNHQIGESVSGTVRYC